MALEDLQTADFWRDRGAAENAVETVRETVRRTGGVEAVLKKYISYTKYWAAESADG
jgi:hypothetical protein